MAHFLIVADPWLLLDDARVAFARGLLARARAGYRAAFAASESKADAAAMAEAALGLGGFWVNDRRSPAEYEEYQACLHAALAALGDERPALAARLRVRIAAEANYALGASLEAVYSAVDDVRALDDPTMLAEALSLLHHLLLAPGYRRERERVSRELAQVAARAGDEFFALMGLLWTTIDAFLAGAPDAEDALERLRVRTAREEVAAFDYVVRTIDVMLALRAGALSEVETMLDDLLAVGTDVGEVDALTWYGAHLLAVRWLQGRGAEMLPLARTMAESPELTRFNRSYPAVCAALAAELGEEDEARAALALVDPFSGPPDGLAPSSVWHLTMFAVAEAVFHLGDAGAAAKTYRALEPFADLPVLASFAVVCFGSTHRALAQCAATMGDRERAIEHQRTAVAHNVRLGNLPIVAVTRAELANLVRATDPASAIVLYEQAIAAGREFRMDARVECWRAERSTLRATATNSDVGRWMRRGLAWEIEAGASRVVVGHCIGLDMLATLVATPGRDVPVHELSGVQASRTSAQKAIRRALDRIAEQDAGLASALRNAVTTGVTCRYDAGSALPSRWITYPGDATSSSETTSTPAPRNASVVTPLPLRSERLNVPS